MNVFTFCGNLGKDCRTGSAGGTNVVNFSVAVKSGYGQNEQTLWLDCSLWGKRGESLAQYLTKGQKVVVSGELGTRDHEGKTYLTCRVSEITLAGAAGDAGSGGQQQQYTPPNNVQPVSGVNAQQPNPQAPASGGAPDDDGGIPF